MKIPPYAVALRIVEQGRTKFRIWFPLFLLWPLAVPLLILTFMATLLVDAVRMLAGHRDSYTRLAVGVLEVVGETRGVEVCIQDKARTFALRLS
jgi:hypothetical protein